MKDLKHFGKIGSCTGCPYKLGIMKTLVNPCITCGANKCIRRILKEASAGHKGRRKGG